MTADPARAARWADDRTREDDTREALQEASDHLDRLEEKLAPGTKTRINGVVQAGRVRQDGERLMEGTTHPVAREAVAGQIERATQLGTDLTEAALRGGADPDLIRFAIGVQETAKHGSEAEQDGAFWRSPDYQEAMSAAPATPTPPAFQSHEMEEAEENQEYEAPADDDTDEEVAEP